MAGIVALAVAALAAASTDWGRVEDLTPGETLVIVLESGESRTARFAGADADTLFVFAAGFERLTRSTRNEVISMLSHASHAVSRIVHDGTTVQHDMMLVSRSGVVRNGINVAALDDVFESLASNRIDRLHRRLHPASNGAVAGAAVGVVHGWVAGTDYGLETGKRNGFLPAFLSAIAVDTAIGYLIGRGRDIEEVVYTRTR